MIGTSAKTHEWMKYQQEEHVSDSLKAIPELLEIKMSPKHTSQALQATRVRPKGHVENEATGTQFKASGASDRIFLTPAKYHSQEPTEQTSNTQETQGTGSWKQSIFRLKKQKR